MRAIVDGMLDLTAQRASKQASKVGSVSKDIVIVYISLYDDIHAAATGLEVRKQLPVWAPGVRTASCTRGSLITRWCGMKAVCNGAIAVHIPCTCT